MDLFTLLTSLMIQPIKILMEFSVSVIKNYFTTDAGLLVLWIALVLVFVRIPLYSYFRRKWRKYSRTQSPGVEEENISTDRIGTGKNFFLSLPVFLEGPILLALYQLLINQVLFSVEFGPFWNLNSPDALLMIGERAVNILPILASVLFAVNGLVSVRRAPWIGKIVFPLIAVAACFFLYNASAAVSLCWGFSSLLLLLLNLRPIRNGQRRKVLKNSAFLKKKANRISLLVSAGLFTILTGLLIPSSVLVASPSEFLESSASINPLWFILTAFLIAAGSSFLWYGALYQLSSRRTKKVLEMIAWVFCGLMLINYLLFKKNLGVISSDLQYEVQPVFSRKQIAINLFAIVAAAIVFAVLMIRDEILCRILSVMLIVALGGLSVRNIWISADTISRTVSQMKKNEKKTFHIPLSKAGKNVIVFMLDRAIGVYLPSIMYERPELASKFSGFVYYPNALSHGPQTNFGSPGLFGGYEYTPAEMNKRNDELLANKHNEALKVMPTLFSNYGYRVTVCDPSYAGYKTTPDLSIFKDIPNVSAYVTNRLFTSESSQQTEQTTGIRNYYCYALAETAPLFLYSCLYDSGNYHQLNENQNTQTQKNMSVATGISRNFMKQFYVLEKLKELTRITEDSENTFLLMINKTTHTPTLLSEPDYLPASRVNNESYDFQHEDRFTNVSFPLQVVSAHQMEHYHALMAAMIQIGEWLDQLRAEGVYDNTRMIIVSDHGWFMNQPGYNLVTGEDLFCYNPLLMVKDFNADGDMFTDDTFMTNADVPSLAMEDLLETPIINPFTGKEIHGEIDRQGPQLVTTSHDWRVEENNGYTFLPADWFSVNGDVLDLSSWEYIGKQ